MKKKFSNCYAINLLHNNAYDWMWFKIFLMQFILRYIYFLEIPKESNDITFWKPETSFLNKWSIVLYDSNIIKPLDYNIFYFVIDWKKDSNFHLILNRETFLFISKRILLLIDRSYNKQIQGFYYRTKPSLIWDNILCNICKKFS